MGSAPKMRVIRTVLGSILFVTATIGASASSAIGDEPVPIIDQVKVRGYAEGSSTAVLSLHGVRRLEGAAVVYFSLGFPRTVPASGSGQDAALSSLGGSNRLFSRKWGTTYAAQCDVAVIDQSAGKIYGPLSSDGKSSPLWCQGKLTGRPGEADVVAAPIASVPESASKVDVSVRGVTFHDVPVENGPMQPEVEVDMEADPDNDASHVVVGAGWPKIPAELIQKADQNLSTYDLKQRVGNYSGSLTESQRSVSVDTDVLFAFDSAKLSPKGLSLISQAVKHLQAKRATSLDVVGYTDNQGADAYNQKLSERRAAAVAAEVKREMPSVTIRSRGEGEKSPIASNKEDATRALNRRVEIVVKG